MLGDIGGYLSSPSNRVKVLELLGQHLVLALLPLLIGLAAALPLGWAAQRSRWLRAAVFGSATVVYTVPALALFVIMPGVLGTRILDQANVVVALTLYTTALLGASGGRRAGRGARTRGDRGFRDGLPTGSAFPRRRVADGYSVFTAGVRMASVSNISLVSVGALIGIGGLGQLFAEGFQTRYLTPIVIGIVLIAVLALVMDMLLVGLLRVATPWTSR